MKFGDADYVARVAVRAMGELTGLINLIKDCTDDDKEYEQYRDVLIWVNQKMALEFFKRIQDEHPEIMPKIDECIEEFGRLP